MRNNNGIEQINNAIPKKEDERFNTPSDLGLRIEKVAKLVGGKKALSTLAKVSVMQVHRYVAGQNVPSAIVLADIAAAGGVRLEWIAIGKGKMLEKDPLDDGFGEGVCVIESYQPSFLAADENINDKNPSRIAFTSDWLRSQGLYPKTLKLTTVHGDAMEPTLSDGSLVIGDVSVETLTEDGLYIIEFDNHVLVRRLQRDFGGGIYIYSDNNAYKSQRLSSDALAQLKIAGKVVWSGGRVF